MSSNKLFGLVALVAASFFSSPASAAVSGVEWTLDKRAIIAGNGCQNNVDAFAAANGDNLSIVFTALGVNLPAGVSPETLADRKSCLVRIPATVERGIYPGQLTQSFTYGVTKSAGARAAIATYSTLFGFNVSPYTWSIPYGVAVDDPFNTQTHTDDFLVNTPWYSGWCSPSRSTSGLLQASIAVTGQRDNGFEDLVVFVDGLDLKYEVASGWYTC